MTQLKTKCFINQLKRRFIDSSIIEITVAEASKLYQNREKPYSLTFYKLEEFICYVAFS